MMKFNTISRFLFLLIYMGAVLVFVSCDDDEASAPEITDVRVIGKPDTSFVAIEAGNMIVIQGRNFINVREVLFNNFVAPFNPNYTTDKSIIVTIPEDAPTEVTDANAPNELKVVTSSGVAVFEFTLLPTPPQIWVLNEFTKPGDQMVLLGNDMFLVEKLIMPGGIDVTDFVINEEGTACTFILPENATEAGPIQMKTKYTIVKTPPINDNTGMIVNFDDIGTLEWGTNKSSDEAAFPGARGEFAHMSFGSIPSNNWSWWEGGRSINTPGSTVWLAQEMLGDPLENYVLKFEIFVKSPWMHGTLLILRNYDWTHVARVAPWRNAPEKVVQTDRWVTVTVPLVFFKTKANGVDGTGDSAPSLEALLGDGTGNLNLFYVNDNTYSEGTQEGFSTGVDNIRLVKVQ
jgi:hypothetical protein